MTHLQATQELDKMYTQGFINQDKFNSKIARIEEIKVSSMHYSAKQNRYNAVIIMAKSGM